MSYSAYIDATKYAEVYPDDVISTQNFNRLAYEASRIIDNWVTGVDGVNKLTVAYPSDDIQIATFTPNFRYWFNGRPFIRQFVGVRAQIAQYDITWGNNVYDGVSFSAGLIFGHVFLTVQLFRA